MSLPKGWRRLGQAVEWIAFVPTGDEEAPMLYSRGYKRLSLVEAPGQMGMVPWIICEEEGVGPIFYNCAQLECFKLYHEDSS